MIISKRFILFVLGPLAILLARRCRCRHYTRFKTDQECSVARFVSPLLCANDDFAACALRALSRSALQCSTVVEHLRTTKQERRSEAKERRPEKGLRKKCFQFPCLERSLTGCLNATLLTWRLVDY